MVTNPQRTVFGAKRLIGRKFSENVVQADMRHWPFRVINKGDDKPLIEINRNLAAGLSGRA